MFPNGAPTGVQSEKASAVLSHELQNNISINPMPRLLNILLLIVMRLTRTSYYHYSCYTVECFLCKLSVLVCWVLTVLLLLLKIQHRHRTLTEQSPLAFPNGAHFQGAQRDHERCTVRESICCSIRSERSRIIPMKLNSTT